MTPLDQIAPAFIEMAHSIVWASVATVDADSRPRSRILHPIWEWDGTDLFGWIATVPSPVKRRTPGRASRDVGELLDRPATTPAAPNAWSSGTPTTRPAPRCGTSSPTAPSRSAMTPTIIPMWNDGPTSNEFAALRLAPVPAAGDARHRDDEGRGRGADLVRRDDDDASTSALPLAPKNPLPMWQLVKCGAQPRHRAGGASATRAARSPGSSSGRSGCCRPIVAVMSRRAGCATCWAAATASSERCIIHEEVRQLAGDSLFVLPNEQWRPRKRALQPVFTKHNVRNFGGQMSQGGTGIRATAGPTAAKSISTSSAAG